MTVTPHLSIGEVLALLQEEFPDVTISKIRFLESQGLIQPERTSAGYRKFYEEDIERLRWVLHQQRDHFLPLKVIRKMLEEGVDRYDPSRGAQPTLFTPMSEEVAPSEDGDSEEDEAADAEVGRPASEVEVPTEPEPERPRTPRSPAHPAVASAPPSPEPRRQRSQTAQAGAPRRSANGGKPASGDADGGEGRRGRPLETPADVVAALQEDPRSRGGGRGPSKDRGRPPGAGSELPKGATTTPASLPEVGAREVTAMELCEQTGLAIEDLAGLERFGLIVSQERAGEACFDDESVAIAHLAARYSAMGVEPRHLRMYLVSAEREAGFIEQLVTPLLKQRNPGSRDAAGELADELASMGAEMHARLLRRELRPGLGR